MSRAAALGCGLCLGLWLGLCLWPAGVRADPASDWEDTREQQRKSYESMVSNMPRPAAGPCDERESCTGTDAGCPPDAVSACS